MKTSQALTTDIQHPFAKKSAEVVSLTAKRREKDKAKINRLVAEFKLLAEERTDEFAPLTTEELIERFKIYSSSPQPKSRRVLYWDQKTGKVTGMTQEQADRLENDQHADIIALTNS
jgi:hypothetical protein